MRAAKVAIRATLLAFLSFVLAMQAAARQDDPRLAALFAGLKAASEPAEASRIEGEIWAVWGETADPASAALLVTANGAIARRDHPRALEALDALVRREPDFAEAWNKRATVNYLIGNYRASVEDIRRTLILEPRHFGALSGLGLIYVAVDEPQAALRSFEAALALHPFLPGAKAHVEMLRGELDGAPL